MARLKRKDITIVVDSREQRPFLMEALGFKVKVGTLKTGDYSVAGLEDLVTVERKSLSDLISCIGTSRGRFEKELKRMEAFKSKCVVVSALESEIFKGGWHYSKILPKQVVGSYTGWMTWGIPFIFARDHEAAAARAAHFLMLFANHHIEKIKCL